MRRCQRSLTHPAIWHDFFDHTRFDNYTALPYSLNRCPTGWSLWRRRHSQEDFTRLQGRKRFVLFNRICWKIHNVGLLYREQMERARVESLIRVRPTASAAASVIITCTYHTAAGFICSSFLVKAKRRI